MLRLPRLALLATSCVTFAAAAACEWPAANGASPDASPGIGDPVGEPGQPSSGGDAGSFSDPGAPGDASPAVFGGTTRAAKRPPAISGGTLLVAQDGVTAVAADPDRDQVSIVDLSGAHPTTSVRLTDGDEPGRVVEDAARRVHVALRRGGAVVTIDLATGALVGRRAVCPAPRGIAYDAAADALLVACVGGELVTLPAGGGAATRTVQLERDLRDVLVRNGKTYVTRFRSAELLELDATGKLVARRAPAVAHQKPSDFAPTVAWRAIGTPHSILMVHQAAQTSPVSTGAGGYGSGLCASGVVRSTVTEFADDGSAPQEGPTLAAAVLPVDLAISGTKIAIVAAGNTQIFGLPRVLTLETSALSTGGFSCVGSPDPLAGGTGQPIAVAYDGAGSLVVQLREPGGLFYKGSVIPTATDSVFDTGHALFHANVGGFIACASCHAEGGDDGFTWSFDGVGPRRTQTFRGGVSGTEPFHWDGDMTDLSTLMTHVFVGRMSGFPLNDDQLGAMRGWLDGNPQIAKSKPADASAVARGKALFQNDVVGCAGCHSGATTTNNQTTDVGTGKAFQVPSLRDLAFRAPYMHDGCAKTLTDRFGACGGGDLHGKTSQLSPAQIADLVAYLETL